MNVLSVALLPTRQLRRRTAALRRNGQHDEANALAVLESRTLSARLCPTVSVGSFCLLQLGLFAGGDLPTWIGVLWLGIGAVSGGLAARWNLRILDLTRDRAVTRAEAHSGTDEQKAQL